MQNSPTVFVFELLCQDDDCPFPPLHPVLPLPQQQLRLRVDRRLPLLRAHAPAVLRHHRRRRRLGTRVLVVPGQRALGARGAVVVGGGVGGAGATGGAGPGLRGGTKGVEKLERK